MNLKENRISKKSRNRTLRDIKMEVGGDTSAILNVIKKPTGGYGRSLPRKTRQTFLGDKELYNVDISESEIINVKKRPDTETLIEVKDFAELKKVEKAFKFINRYEDDKEVIYFVGNYFYMIHKT
ncbi:MAG TPA: hypothetical protein ENG12_05470 [Candidatus Altiarchaeales archaeon]|nr:hypothetical protein [Candidatus Altiarchaeales archaeon]